MENSGYSLALGKKSEMFKKSTSPVIVYTYMCGDILHCGHILYLKNAKALGDVLIVGVLTDEAIVERKNPPVMSMDERIRAIEAIKYVDLVVCQNTYSPIENILNIKPDIIVESSSHDEELIMNVKNNAPVDTRIIILPYYNGLSSRDIKKRIKNTNHVVNMLNPWYHPVEICGETVIPGIGSGRSPQELIDRNKFREKLLVDQVIKNYDFKGKSILDVGSNISYWCSKYVKHGATNVIALEGRNKYILQGLLYWGSNEFLPENNYKFINCDILDPIFWQNNMVGKKFDFIFCGGIFHHIKDHDFLMKKLIESSTEAVLIDTKIGDNTLKLKTDNFFGNIESYDELKLPDVNHIINTFIRNGFKHMALTPLSSCFDTMRSEDDYCNEKRAAMLFVR